MGKPEIKNLAQILYMQGYLQKEIATKVGVTEQTICRWARQGNWETMKKGMLNAKMARLSELYDELQEFSRMIKEKVGYKVASSKEADARRKLIMDIQALETKYNIGQITTIARDFCEFVKSIDFEFAARCSQFFDAFIEQVIEKQKWQNQND